MYITEVFFILFVITPIVDGHFKTIVVIKCQVSRLKHCDMCWKRMLVVSDGISACRQHSIPAVGEHVNKIHGTQQQ